MNFNTENKAKALFKKQIKHRGMLYNSKRIIIKDIFQRIHYQFFLYLYI